MSDLPPAKSKKTRWWREFLVYGANTQFLLLPFFVGLLAVLGLSLVNGIRRAGRTANSVILYCAQDQFVAEPILAEFTRTTGILVKPVFDSEAVKTVGLANRLLAERSHPVCDIFWGNEEFRTRQLAAAGVFPATNGWVAFGQRSRRIVINTHRVKDSSEAKLESERTHGSIDPYPTATAPHALRELTNAEWRGKVSVAFPLFGTTATHFLALRQHWGESNWLVWCRALKANQPFIEEGNSQVVQRVARGEAWVGLTDSDDIAAGQREGLPVAALPIDATSLLIPNTLGLVARPEGIPPLAQRLFDYLRSPAVQSRLTELGALEEPKSSALTLHPDWARLLLQLNEATAQTQEVFRR